MNNNVVNVVQKDYLKVYENIKFFTINIVSLQLNISVGLSVSLYNSNNNLLITENLLISGEEYSNWSNDDAYLAQLVANKLNLRIE